VSGFNGGFIQPIGKDGNILLRDLEEARRVVESWADEDVLTTDELTTLDNVRLACSRLAESIEAFIGVHDELDPDNH
jgi:hypothetical protein